MWPFSKKLRIIHEIEGAVWGILLREGFDVGTLSNDVRCVHKKGSIEGGIPVTDLRVFKLSEAAGKGVEITGWETFDQHPELILFEGYRNDQSHHAFLERKNAQALR